jgi:hypothetical protein
MEKASGASSPRFLREIRTQSPLTPVAKVCNRKGEGDRAQSLGLQVTLTIFFDKMYEFHKINVQPKQQNMHCQNTHAH